MTRGILIAGNESSLFSAVAAEAVKRVESFAAAIIPNRLPLPEGGTARSPKAENSGGAIPLSWNPASPISARTLVLAAENRLAQINDAIVICSPPAVFKTAVALLPEEIEIMVNDHIKGWFFLIRELALYFRRTGSGSLSLIVPDSGKEAWGGEGGINALSMNALGLNARDMNTRGVNAWEKNNPADLLGPSASASFRVFAQGVLASSENEPFQVKGFTTGEAGAETDFAAWFFKLLDEGAGKNSGRWLRFSKRKFFG